MDEPDATGTPVPTDTATPAPGSDQPQPTPTVTVTVTPEPTPAPSGGTLQDVSTRLDHVSVQLDGLQATALVVGILLVLAAGVSIVKAMR